MAAEKGAIRDALKRGDENVRILIKEVKVRNNLTKRGVSRST